MNFKWCSKYVPIHFQYNIYLPTFCHHFAHHFDSIGINIVIILYQFPLNHHHNIIISSSILNIYIYFFKLFQTNFEISSKPKIFKKKSKRIRKYSKANPSHWPYMGPTQGIASKWDTTTGLTDHCVLGTLQASRPRWLTDGSPWSSQSSMIQWLSFVFDWGLYGDCMGFVYVCLLQ